MTRTASSALAASTAARISPGITSSIALSRSGRLRVTYALASRTSYDRVVNVVMLTSSYCPADTSEPVRETTVGSGLREAAAAAPDTVALVEGAGDPTTRRRWTYAELLRDAERAAAALTTRFEPGERVAVWAPNIPEWVILEFALALAGLTLVTVNPAYRPSELAYVLQQSGAAGIFLVPEFRSPMADYLEQVRADVPGLREV